MVTSLAAPATRRYKTAARRGSLVTLVAAISVILGLCATSSAPVAAATQQPERSLMGIKVFDKASIVLKKYGAPAKIMSAAAPPAGSAAAAAPQGGPPRPGSEFNTPGPIAPPPAASSTAAGAPAANQVVYEYNTKSGTTLDFTISTDGRVIQISAAGQKNAEVRTLRGVTLGTTYIDVINKYGYPESQDVDNAVITMRYVDKAHVAFQLFNQKVVSVTVAAVE